MKAPHLPEIRSPTDTKYFDNFDDTFENVKDELSGWDHDF